MDAWEQAAQYEEYMGRWSRPMARRFLAWLDAPGDADWLDIDCGTGALSRAIVDNVAPRRLSAVDPSPAFIAAVQYALGPEADVRVGEAGSLPFDAATFDMVVSGLALNFMPHTARALAEMQRVARENGMVAAYVWDYADGMEMIRVFWDTAISLDPSIAELDEAARFPLCRPEPLRAAFEHAALTDVEVEGIEIATSFASFDDYWEPLLGGQGPAPSYVMSLDERQRTSLRHALRDALSPDDGSILLTARAWAIRGIRASP